MKLLFFSSFAEIAGCDEIEISGDYTILELKSYIEAKYPAVQNLQYAIAVNKIIVHDNIKLNKSDEVAFLPPFSGG